MTQTPTHPTRRRYLRTTGVAVGTLALGLGATGSVGADASNNPAMPGRIYADDRLFATGDLTDLPPPSGNNAHSFDEIYVFAEEPTHADQFPVAEAAPGERDFNGGRWSVTTVKWTISDPPLVTNDDMVHYHEMEGHIEVLDEGVRYFECPLVPLDD